MNKGIRCLTANDTQNREVKMHRKLARNDKLNKWRWRYDHMTEGILPDAKGVFYASLGRSHGDGPSKKISGALKAPFTARKPNVWILI
jgi:hypothetical protein